ncbi:bifunctional transcriptional activator/DNA repair enzyme AdaA [Fodinibius salsisoli]|uniref:Methylated-DNA--[protein]-cysteine S-methyltransferase n=1 Tax=Fodinibius salsisoli TaxID=2820877 RepID=A0ABT3PI93_9BACT|nr:methylated-DNA--[protein]-cysteine S-methyltransferase [Fodinibius salsisoli]MCW9705646.1 methylated-DNA--[protein]-cysteine S-methyltransferase [Fodinibius salsisoli]
MIDYQRVAKAITYINEYSAEQPNLDDVAEAVHLSPYHFHRMFKEWAGVTPKEFLQFISLNHAKKLLNKNQTIEEATFHTGLSSSSRLHDLFVNIEGMTPGEFKNEGENLSIRYHFTQTPFGDMLAASTGKGLSNLMFVANRDTGLQTLQNTWTNADLAEGEDIHIKNIERVFADDWENLDEVKLHIQGTDFQLKVWEALLKIPSGQLAAYSDVAEAIGKPRASRAVGTALARNPVAYLIPCHRVIKKVGGIGEYRWGSTRKTAIIGWEAAQTSDD